MPLSKRNERYSRTVYIHFKPGTKQQVSSSKYLEKNVPFLIVRAVKKFAQTGVLVKSLVTDFLL